MPGRRDKGEKAEVKLIDVPVEEKQVTMAVRALYNHLLQKAEEADKPKLFDEDQEVILQIALKRATGKKRISPIRIPLKNPIYGLSGDICLITKDPQSAWEEMLEETPVSGVTKILGMKKLKSDYTQPKDKRELQKSFELFLADDRIVGSLPKLLGKTFYNSKKLPSPVVLRKGPSFAKHLEQARDSTYLFLAAGSCCQVRIGRTGFTVKETVENILGSLPYIVKHLPKKLSNVQAIFVKTNSSVALPIYTSDVNVDEEVNTEEKTLTKKEMKAAKTAKKQAKNDKKKEKTRSKRKLTEAPEAETDEVVEEEAAAAPEKKKAKVSKKASSKKAKKSKKA